MKQWEQILFAIALAGFGWLLYQGNKSGASNTVSTASGPINQSVVPWYLNYNIAAGFTGPIATTQSLTQIATPNNAIGQQNTSDPNTCLLCQQFPSMQL